MTPLKCDEASLFKWAAHEAGHAVAAIVEARRLGLDDDVVLGLKLDKAGVGTLINHRGVVIHDCRAFCELSDSWMALLRDVPQLPVARRRAQVVGEAHIVVLLAGPYAELEAVNARDKFVFAGNPDLKGSEHDLCEVNGLRRKLESLHVRRRAWLKIHLAAQVIVQDHWSAINAIARLLLRAGYLPGHQVQETLNHFYRAPSLELIAA